MDGVVAPLLHCQLTPLVLVEAVSVTLPPEQKVVLPLADTIGVTGWGFAVTVMLLVVMVQPAGEVICAEYVPDVPTVMDGVVAPLLQRMLLPDAVLTFSCTLPPSQKVALPLADMLPVGIGLTVTSVLPVGTDIQPSTTADT